MAVKLFGVLLLIGVFQGLNLQPIFGSQCSKEEASEITTEYAQHLDELSNDAGASIDQQIDEIKNNNSQTNEHIQLQKAILENKEALNNLQQELCNEKVKLKIQSKIAHLNITEARCVDEASKKEISVKAKAEFAAKKVELYKTKAATVIGRCGLRVFGGCASVQQCCEQALNQVKVRIDVAKDVLVNGVTQITTAQNSCLKKVIKEGLKLELLVKEEVLECKIQEPADSNESGDSSEENNTSTQAPQTEPPQEVTNDGKQTTVPHQETTSDAEQPTQPNEGESSQPEVTNGPEVTTTNNNEQETTVPESPQTETPQEEVGSTQQPTTKLENDETSSQSEATNGPTDVPEVTTENNETPETTDGNNDQTTNSQLEEISNPPVENEETECATCGNGE